MRRRRNVRMSVRTLTETRDATQGSVTSSWSHLRYQRFTLWALEPDKQRKMDRDGYDATWGGQARDLPAVPDTAKLVALDADDVPVLTLKVQKVMQTGRVQKLWLLEVAEVQS